MAAELSPTSSFSSSTGTATTTGASKSDAGNNNNNLYLFTFLATLFLLLLISSSLVLRSFILRRRRIEQAIALGLYPGPQGHRRRRLGAKPKLHDVWVDDGERAKDVYETWDDIMPVAVQPLRSKRRKLTPAIPPSPAVHSNPPRQGIVSWFNWQRPNIHSEPPTPDTDSKPPPPKAEPIAKPAMLQVSVLVAMPSAQKTQHSQDFRPDIMLGTTRMPCKPDQQQSIPPAVVIP